MWDEALKLQAADNDYHRRDLHEAIERGDFPEWELGLQLFDQKLADALPYDVLDATKLIPEELVPIKLWAAWYSTATPTIFAETEQVAYCPANIVPGIDFTNDPLLQEGCSAIWTPKNQGLERPTFTRSPLTHPNAR